MIKSIRIAGMFVITAVICSSFTPLQKMLYYEPAYIVAVAREQAKSGGKNEQVVTNVIYFKCERNYGRVESQLKDYYDANYKSSRNTMYIKDELEFSFDSRFAAEKKRTELIAKYRNNGDNPLLIEKFAVSCD